MILSDPIVAELREKLTEKFNVPQEDADAVVDHLKTYAEIVPAQGRSGWVNQDPDDDKFIDAALAAAAQSSSQATATCSTWARLKESRSSPRASSWTDCRASPKTTLPCTDRRAALSGLVSFCARGPTGPSKVPRHRPALG